MTQADMLLEFFAVKQDISPLEAHNVLKVRSLSRRINDLEERGYAFRREWKRDATGQRYTRYTFVGPVQPELTLAA